MNRERATTEATALEDLDWLADGSHIDDRAASTWTYEVQSDRERFLRDLDQDLRESFDKVHTLRHDVSVGAGRALRVIESFTLGSWLRKDHRAILFLPSSVHKGQCWRIPYPGYDAMSMAARRGTFVYTIDYLGVGDSFRPTDGREVTVDRNVEAARQAIRYIRYHRSVGKVDLVGEGYGGIVASQLAADSRRIRSCVMIAVPYKELAGGPSAVPEQVERLRRAPNGYLTMRPAEYDMFLGEAPSDVREFIRTTQSGDYPVSFTLVVLQKPPFFDPSVAQVPGLILCGSKDPVLGKSDPHELAADYGSSGARLVVSEQAGHAPRVESPAVAGWLWSEIFRFVEAS